MLKCIKKMPFKSDAWPGSWIWHPDNGRAFDVVLFAVCFKGSSKSKQVKLHISSDNRYKLYLDGKFIGLGPQRGDEWHWFFDTYELVIPSDSRLHVLSAIAWHDRDTAPTGQISFRPGLMVAAEKPYDKIISTSSKWRCRRLADNAAISLSKSIPHVGPGFDMQGLTKEDLSPSPKSLNEAFLPAQVICKAAYNYFEDLSLSPWRLQPRTIDALESMRQNIGKCRDIKVIKSQQSNGVLSCANIDSVCVTKAVPVVIPPYSDISILLDHKTLTSGYPIIKVSNGKEAIITLTYQEALHRRNNSEALIKGDRNIVKNKSITIGVMDVLRPDGRTNLVFEPFWFRCWRYIKVDIQTKQWPLELKSITYMKSAYPLKLNAVVNNKAFEPLLEPCFRTLKLCANETFMDCPYYEQLQYLGDTRIQALLSYVLSNDDKLAKAAISSFDCSRFFLGFTQSHYPARTLQVIPTFSLWYIFMLNDYLLWRGDSDFVHNHLNAVNGILTTFERYTNSDNLIGKLPHWIFVDWATNSTWGNLGVPPGAMDGKSFMVSFLYLYALQEAIRLFTNLNLKSQVENFRSKANTVQKVLEKYSFDKDRSLFVDEYDGKHISQHTNILAILTGTNIGLIESEDLLKKLLTDQNMARTSIYFKFYLFEAMFKSGRADLIFNELELWNKMLKKGLSTFSETEDPTRSDCHGWSSHPAYHYFTSVLGVRPLAPGCSTLSITQPRVNNLVMPKLLEGAFNIPQGELKIRHIHKGNRWKTEVTVPNGVQFVYSP